MLKVLNNIGIVGSILAACADIVFVLIMVLGIEVHTELNAIVIFSIVNALIGLLINILLRYQGVKYAEIENEDICKRFYNKRIKEKNYLSIEKWMFVKSIQDFLIKGVTTAFSIFGIIYITIVGSKNPIQILITLASLILFACFGLIGMNSAYSRFYNVQIPYMEKVVNARNNENNRNNLGSNNGSNNTSNNTRKKNTKITKKKIKENSDVNNREQSVS